MQFFSTFIFSAFHTTMILFICLFVYKSHAAQNNHINHQQTKIRKKKKIQVVQLVQNTPIYTIAPRSFQKLKRNYEPMK